MVVGLAGGSEREKEGPKRIRRMPEKDQKGPTRNAGKKKNERALIERHLRFRRFEAAGIAGEKAAFRESFIKNITTKLN